MNKSEIRSTKSEAEMTKPSTAPVSNFLHSLIRICFGFRVSIFGFLVLLTSCGNPVLDHPPVSRQTLRDVDTLALEPAPPPTTYPSTMSATAPTTRPAQV